MTPENNGSRKPISNLKCTDEELAMRVMVTCLPPSDIENPKTGKLTGKASKLRREIANAIKTARAGDGDGRMVQIDDYIKELQAISQKWGNTCVYIRDCSWGSVALNRQAEDELIQATGSAS